MKSRFLSLIYGAICVSTAAIAISLMPALPAISQPVDSPSYKNENVLKSLNLSDAQRQQIQVILARSKESRRTSMEELRTREQELRTMMDGNASKEALIQKFNQIQALRRQNDQNKFEQMLAMREVLTPQQRSQLSKAAAEAKGKWRERRERRLNTPN